MAEHSPIGWTDSTWPIIAGCDYVSPGCSNCWAVRDSWRLAHNPHKLVRDAFADVVRKTDDGKLVWTGHVRPLPQRLDWPLKWRAPRLIFVCSQADLFSYKVPPEFIAAAFGVMAASPLHTFQVLTKHPKRMREFLDSIARDREGPVTACLWAARQALGADVFGRHEPFPDQLPAWPLENVWVGVTVEDQKRANERIPELLRTPAAVRWLSVEPMLEAIDLTDIRTPHEHTERGQLHELADLDWVVCGGESAQTRATTRPFDIGWARDLRDQCRAAGVRFFFKQYGSRPTENGQPIAPPVGKSSRYKFHEPEHWQADLRIQEFPT